jgi:hypothetical protein
MLRKKCPGAKQRRRNGTFIDSPISSSSFFLLRAKINLKDTLIV